eukprot:TRINITY_DN2774_c0_g1_i1.p1 TRINITY_DN2774_c0_g1~~TRINITY_DN2774_c0_g1_i1.p1  ORF type:complete len:590 (+),score=164.15 TRINITY_DN2774_c0_g1_i1:45-1814(+)
MSLKQITAANGIKAYDLSNPILNPEFISELLKRQNRKKDAYTEDLQLIQDFECPVATNDILYSDDGSHILITGVYPPQLRCFETEELSRKFLRGVNSEILRICSLSGDWRKLAFLHVDRYIEIHTGNGLHHKLRVPHEGRDLAYLPSTCDLYCAAASNEVYRINLEEGRFMKSLFLEAPEATCIEISKVHNLIAVGTINNTVEFFDPRIQEKLCEISLDGFWPSNSEISSLCFHSNGLQIAIGGSLGNVSLFDLRSNKPLWTKEHGYDSPVCHMKWHKELLLSIDSYGLRIWNKNGSLFTVLETPSQPRRIECRETDGIVFIAGECPRVMAYYFPALGFAPSWCSYLEGVTEELGDETPMYTNYMFVTEEDIIRLGLTSLLGDSTLLKPYMHGFYIDRALYEKVSLENKTYSEEELRLHEITKRLKKERSQHISSRRKNIRRIANVNVIDDEEEDSDVDVANEETVDPRFAELFNDPSYTINSQSDDDENDTYQQLQIGNNADEGESDEDSDMGLFNLAGDSDSESEAEELAAPMNKRKAKKVKIHQMNTDVLESKSTSEERSLPLSERIKNNKEKNARRSGEMSFTIE